MFYKPSNVQPGVTRLDKAVILAHYCLKYVNHLVLIFESFPGISYLNRYKKAV